MKRYNKDWEPELPSQMNALELSLVLNLSFTQQIFMQNEKQELFKVACSLPWNTLRACAWHSVFVGLNQDVSETPFAEEGFACRSAHTFLRTCLKS